MFLTVKGFAEAAVDGLLNESLKLVQSYTNTVLAQQGQKADYMLASNTKLIELALHLVTKIIFLFPSNISQLYKFPNIAQTFETVWTVIESKDIQHIWAVAFNEICKKVDALIINQKLNEEFVDLNNPAHRQAIEMLPSFYLMRLIMGQCLPKALLNHQNTGVTLQMFIFAETLCRQTDVVQYLHLTHPSQSINILVSELAGHIRQRPINEFVDSQHNQEDSVLRYLMILLQTILNKRPAARNLFLEKNDLVAYLFSECLFMKDERKANKGQPQGPKCKT
jgi:hypothetical protein